MATVSLLDRFSLSSLPLPTLPEFPEEYKTFLMVVTVVVTVATLFFANLPTLMVASILFLEALSFYFYKSGSNTHAALLETRVEHARLTEQLQTELEQAYATNRSLQARLDIRPIPSPPVPNAEVERLRTEQQAAIQSLQTRADEATRTIESLSTENTRLTQDNARLNTKMDLIRTQQRALLEEKHAKEQLQKQVADLSVQKSNLVKENADLFNKMNVAKDAAVNIQARYEDLLDQTEMLLELDAKDPLMIPVDPTLKEIEKELAQYTQDHAEFKATLEATAALSVMQTLSAAAPSQPTA